MPLLCWQQDTLDPELDAESENDEWEEDFDLNSLLPKEKELRLGSDCLSRDSTKLCFWL